MQIMDWLYIILGFVVINALSWCHRLYYDITTAVRVCPELLVSTLTEVTTTAIFEEILFRGYWTCKLGYDDTSFYWNVTIFTLIHLANYQKLTKRLVNPTVTCRVLIMVIQLLISIYITLVVWDQYVIVAILFHVVQNILALVLELKLPGWTNLELIAIRAIIQVQLRDISHIEEHND